MKKIGFLVALALTTSLVVGCDSNKEIIENSIPTDNNIISDIKEDDNTSKDDLNNDKKEDLSKEEAPVDKNTDANDDSSKEESLGEGRIYYYEGFDQVNYYIKTDVPASKDEKLNYIVDSLKNLPNNDFLEYIENQEFTPLPSYVSINSAEFLDNLIKVDFNRNFTENLGSSGETAVLESLVNTIGYNFSVNNVIITFNGENYSSGHISMEDNEPFVVNKEKSIELVNSKK